MINIKSQRRHYMKQNLISTSAKDSTMKVVVLVAALVACAVAAEAVTHFYGYQVIRTFPKSNEQFNALHKLEEQGHLDFWTGLRRGRPTDIMVSPHQMKAFKAHLLKHKINFEVLIANVEGSFEAERQAQAVRQARMDWTAYHTIEEIQAWLEELKAEYPDLVTVENLGSSYEGRDLPVVKVSSGAGQKRAIWFDGNIHAREWISPAVVTYILNELVTKSAEYKELLDNFDFYVVTNVNPDGYAFTHSDNRLWRKTRSDSNSPLKCIGTDANRNWGYLWGEPGASSNKCDDTYRGLEAFSEPENLLIKEYIERTDADWLLFITFHSYGQYCLLPYGDGTRPDDYDELLEKANIFADALESESGTRYAVGNSEDLLYTTSGTSHDWAKGSGLFKYAYTVELRDQGTYGFRLPANQIIPTGVETWRGFQALLNSLIETKA